MTHRINPEDLLLTAMASALVMLTERAIQGDDSPETMAIAAKYGEMYGIMRDQHPGSLADVMRAIPLQHLQRVFTMLVCTYGETALQLQRTQPSEQTDATGKETGTDG